MASGVTFSDVERRKFPLSGDSFSAAQQTQIGNLITDAENEVIGKLGGSEPTWTDALKNLVTEIVYIWLKNAENPDKPDEPTWNTSRNGVIKHYIQQPDVTEEQICETGLIRDYADYYGR